MAKIDLKDAYFAVPIEMNSRKFLRFQFKNILYQFNCLPFGLNIAPYVFTKILKPALNYLRSQGFMSVIFLDDIFLISKTFESCVKNITETCSLLSMLGFTLTQKKVF